MFEDLKSIFTEKAVSYATAAVMAFSAVALEGCSTTGMPRINVDHIQKRGEQEIRRGTYGVRQGMARGAAGTVNSGVNAAICAAMPEQVAANTHQCRLERQRAQQRDQQQYPANQYNNRPIQ